MREIICQLFSFPLSRRLLLLWLLLAISLIFIIILLIKNASQAIRRVGIRYFACGTKRLLVLGIHNEVPAIYTAVIWRDFLFLPLTNGWACDNPIRVLEARSLSSETARKKPILSKCDEGVLDAFFDAALVGRVGRNMT